MLYPGRFILVESVGSLWHKAISLTTENKFTKEKDNNEHYPFQTENNKETSVQNSQQTAPPDGNVKISRVICKNSHKNGNSKSGNDLFFS